jgi:hypothetical protein
MAFLVTSEWPLLHGTKGGYDYCPHSQGIL